MKLRSALFLSLALFFLWWGYLSVMPVDSGLDVLPSPLVLGKDLLITFSYLCVFVSLATEFPALYGSCAVLGFGLTPLFYFADGLAMHDHMVFLFWTAVVFYSFRSSPSAGQPKPLIILPESVRAHPVPLAAVAGILGSWALPNTGIAFSIALFTLALSSRSHGGRLPYWRMGTAAAAGAVATASLHRLFISAQNVASGPLPFQGILGNLTRLGTSFYVAGQSPFFFAMGCFVAALLLGQKPAKSAADRGREIVWNSTACLVGLITTLFASFLWSGFAEEWTHQLMPFTLLFTVWLFGILVVAVDSLILER